MLSNIPRRVAHRFLRYALQYVQTRPRIKATARNLLANFPLITMRLKNLARTSTNKSLHKPRIKRHVLNSANSPIIHSDCQYAPTPLVAFPAKQGYRKIYYYVDHTILCPVNTGMQRVARRLGRALFDAGELVCFVKWDAQEHQMVLLNHDELAQLAKWNGPALSAKDKEPYPISDSHTVPVASHVPDEGHWLVVPEVTHITYQEQPMTLEVLMEAKHLGLKTAFIFYDATPLRRVDLKEMASSHEAYMQQLLLADLIIPISNWSARDLVSFFTTHEGATLTPTPRITALPLPGESQLAPRVTVPPSLDQVGKTILSVGTISLHKNQLTLVKAFQRYCDIHPETGWELVLVGALHPDLADDLARATAKNFHIKHLIQVSDDELVELYRTCSFSVFPSVEEGFGLPILESLWYAKPCVCANFGAMAEVAEGGGCLTIDTRETDELLRAITRLTVESGLLEQLSHEAVARTITNWDDYSKKFIAQINEASDPLKQMGVIYYWIDHTATHPANTGIQRVVRGLARALIEIGLTLVPVKWDEANHQLCPPSEDDLHHLALWNGPQPSEWGVASTKATERDWLLIPELTTYMTRTSLSDLRCYASAHNLRIACVFFDAIPWKIHDLYSEEASSAHEQYMEGLNEFELILPISQFSRVDLISFLSATSLRITNLENKIQASVLPGEFLESERITTVKQDAPLVKKILCVGTVEPRKNHLGLLQAFAQMVQCTKNPVELVIAGGDPFDELAKQVKHYIDTVPGIRWEKSVSDTRLRELYAECDFTVYPSLEEGFGLPILESLWYARPCICRDSGAMAEVAKGGGCLMVETNAHSTLAQAMLRMVENDALRFDLAREATIRPFKTWHDYAREVATRMATERYVPLDQPLPQLINEASFYTQFVNLRPRPLLSICITTYNRAEWLSVSLKNLARLLPGPCAEIEIVVCDNTSSDRTPDVVQPYLHRADFRYYRNPENVGMLGNLRVTAHHARGRYIWILGDDDLVKSGSIEKIVHVLKTHPDLALVYLNYAYTHEDDANAVTDIDKFLSKGIPVVTPGTDILGTVSRVSTQSENFFTAIYCLVFRRDHALRAYSQNTDGRPFSTMLTCIPTTNHILHFMMNEPAYWIGEPQMVVNLNVSWMKYAPIWILERLPEAHDLAEKMGANPQEIDKCRINHIPHILHWFREIYEHDEESNIIYFSPSRLISRIKHLDGFADHAQTLWKIYENAHTNGHPGAKIPPSPVFSSFNNI